MKRSGFKTRSGFVKKSGLKRKRNPNKRIKEKTRESPLWKQIKKTDTVYSIIVRLRAANERGIVQCYTCNYRAFWKQSGIECGHYHSRANLGVRWSDINCKPQCHICNTDLGGNLKVFRENLIKEYGKKVVNELKQQAEKIVRLRVDQVREMRLEFNKILKELQKEKNI